VLAIALCSTVVLGLAACAPDDRPIVDDPTTSPSASSAPSASGTPTAEPDSGSPIDISCSQLVSDQVIYDWGNGNFAADPNFSPAAGSPAAEAVAADGVACGWINLTSGETVTVSAADLGADALVTVTSDLAASSAPASSLGEGGYFVASGGIGHADVVRGSLWVSAESALFGEAADAKPLVSAAVSAIG